ncbi:unnamed protein product [Amoebophrya sp. A25]|nr:unnamed protein product [Amoebophrya sp. A25]|eukprot:GSA25T00010172001.1
MAMFYHATPARNKESIERNGFFPGSHGYDGAGIYFCKRPEAAINRARIRRHEDAVVFACQIPDSDSVVSNVNNQDNFKVESEYSDRIKIVGTSRYDEDEVSQIKCRSTQNVRSRVSKHVIPHHHGQDNPEEKVQLGYNGLIGTISAAVIGGLFFGVPGVCLGAGVGLWAMN